jgi:hypothetical protein
MTEKACKRCKETKPINMFAFRKETNNYRGVCKKCKSEKALPYNRLRYAKDKEALLIDRKRRFFMLKLETLIAYGGMCVCCKEADYRFLTIDHINGGGTKERKQLRMSAMTFYSHLKKNDYPEGYQVLCYNCNCAKNDKPYCPHNEPNDMAIELRLRYAKAEFKMDREFRRYKNIQKLMNDAKSQQ